MKLLKDYLLDVYPDVTHDRWYLLPQEMWPMTHPIVVPAAHPRWEQCLDVGGISDELGKDIHELFVDDQDNKANQSGVLMQEMQSTAKQF